LVRYQHAAPYLLLAVVSLLFHLPALTAGLIAVEDDTRVFYFPLLVVTARALSELTLPLWTPGIFAGYPLFADGEAGMLYPLHYLVLPWLAPEASLVVLRVVHSFLASAFMHLLLRTLGMGMVAGVVGGITFGYSGFAAGQIIHDNVFHAMVWLPLELALVERACQSLGASRYRWAMAAGVVVGVQALAAHIHVTLMSAGALSAFALYRGLVEGDRGQGTGDRARVPQAGPQSPGRPPTPDPRPPRWPPTPDPRPLVSGLVRALVIVAIVGAVGVGLSAAQLIPLYELGTQTFRGDGVGARLAATNSVWPGDVLTLLLPRLHDTPTGGFWGPWVKWETVLYVGILPLALASVGMVARRGPYRGFFGWLALAALVLALGPAAPGSPWAVLHSLPGFEVLQSPGRFSLLLSLAVAVLAGYGADWLTQRPSAGRGPALIVLLGGMAVAGGLAVGLEGASNLLRAPSAGAIPPLQDYVRLPGIPASVDGIPLTFERVALLAADSLSPWNPTTAWQLLLVVAAGGVITMWLADPRIRGAAACATIVVILSDLWMLSATFHPYGPVDGLRPRVPDALLADADRPFRVHTPATAEEKNTQVEPNRLLAAGIDEASGYSSLAPDRHAAYSQAVAYADNRLIDLWNVRYVVRRLRPPPLPSHGGTSFHPERPLFSGRRVATGGGGSLLPDGGPARAHEVRVVAALWDAADVRDGTSVARIVLQGTDESDQTLELVAGKDVSDTMWDVPGRAPALHGRAEVAFEYPRDDAKSYRYAERLYYASLPVDPPMTVRRVTIEPLGQVGGLEVFGVGLLNVVTGEVTQARDKAKYQEVYRDDQIRILRNAAAMPRAFMVGSGWLAPPGRDALAWMLDGTIDLSETVVLERPIPPGVAIPSGGASAAASPGVASIQSYSPERVTIRTESQADALLVLGDAYFPGWVARVDGEPTPILRANYLFRAVVLPSGPHLVTFAYEPLSVAVGMIITLATACVVIAVVGAQAFAALCGRTASPERPRSARPLAEPRPHPSECPPSGGLGVRKADNPLPEGEGAFGAIQSSSGPGLDR